MEVKQNSHGLNFLYIWNNFRQSFKVTDYPPDEVHVTVPPELSRGGSVKAASTLPPTGKYLSVCSPFFPFPTSHFEASLPAGGMVKWSVGP